MALTWATRVRFGRATRRNKRENELHYLFALCFLDYFGHFVLGRVFGPSCFLGPFQISVAIWGLGKNYTGIRRINVLIFIFRITRYISSWVMLHKHLTNPIVSVERIDTFTTGGGILGNEGQNKYTLIKKDKNIQKVTDADLDDDVHPMDIVKMKNIIDEFKGNPVVIRRALDSLKCEGAKVYKRAALADFDLCINFEYSTKVLIPPPNTSIPAEIPSKLVRTGTIFDTPEICAVFKDANKEKALFRINEICRYSNQTLKYIRNCINEKQEQLNRKGKNNE
ncbi:hypothetical protein Hanom_Chr10g00885151 [Helianthus anomalus]